MVKAKRGIKYESELDHNFSKEIARTPGGEDILKCIQCGVCSGTCPLSLYMDYMPRQVIGMVREGFKDDVLTSQTIWVCSSCYACTVECPRQIKLTDVMYTLKRMAIEKGIYPKDLPIPILAREFFDIVAKKGRSSEVALMIRVGMKTGVLRLARKLGFGFKLMRKGRLSPRMERVSNPSEISKIVKAISKTKG